MEIRNGNQIIRMGPGGMTCIQGSNVIEMNGRGINVRNGSQKIKMNSNGISILSILTEKFSYSKIERKPFKTFSIFFLNR